MEFENKQKIINKLSHLRQVGPGQDFINRVKTNLIYSLIPQQTKKTPIFNLRLAAMTLVFIFFVSGGTVFASGNSLPGDFLYSVKKTLESVQIRLASDPEDKANLRLQLIDERLTELQELSQKQSKALENASIEYEEAVFTALENAKKSNVKKEELLDKLEEKFNQHTQVLEQVAQKAPSQAQNALNKASAASQKGAEAAKEAQEKNLPNKNNSGGGD